MGLPILAAAGGVASKARRSTGRCVEIRGQRLFGAATRPGFPSEKTFSLEQDSGGSGLVAAPGIRPAGRACRRPARNRSGEEFNQSFLGLSQGADPWAASGRRGKELSALLAASGTFTGGLGTANSCGFAGLSIPRRVARGDRGALEAVSLKEPEGPWRRCWNARGRSCSTWTGAAAAGRGEGRRGDDDPATWA